MAAGLAGGMGLSGNACGALGAAVWMISLKRLKDGEKGASFQDKELEGLIQNFYEKTDFEMECKVITGREFKSLDEHTEYIQSGGCRELIDILAGQ
jgi:hypothetical protein